MNLNPYVILAYFVVASSIIGGTYTYAQHRQFKYDEAAQAVKTLAIERAANKKVAEANIKAETTNVLFNQYRQNAEIKNHEAQIVIDTTRTELASVKRLRDPYSKPASCSGLPKDTAATRDTPSQATPSELSEEFSGFLKQQAYEADQVAVYATTCHEWAMQLVNDR